MTEPCYACTVAQLHPKTTLRGNADCMGCDARALALVYGGMERDEIERQLRRLWPNQADYTAGRLKFWIWVKAIQEAKDKP